MGSGSGFGSGLRPGTAGGKMFAEHCSWQPKAKMPCFSPGAQDGQAQGRLTVFRLTLGQGGQAQDSWALGS